MKCSWIEEGAAGIGRTFRLLDLERSDVMLFPLSWTLVHPITNESPLYGLTGAHGRLSVDIHRIDENDPVPLPV